MKKTTVAIFITAFALLGEPALAREGVVTAHSRFGNGSVEGAVREARYGLEVQLPSGSWVGCRTSCSETLRVQSVDFLEGQDGGTSGYGTMQQECGVFGCLDIGW